MKLTKKRYPMTKGKEEAAARWWEGGLKSNLIPPEMLGGHKQNHEHTRTKGKEQ